MAQLVGWLDAGERSTSCLPLRLPCGSTAANCPIFGSGELKMPKVTEFALDDVRRAQLRWRGARPSASWCYSRHDA